MAGDRSMRTLVGAGLLALAASSAWGQAAPEPPEGLAWMVLRDINAAYFDPDDPTNRPPLATEVPEGVIRAVDVSRDGRPDWLVDYGVEAAAVTGFCGTGGCLKRLYVSTEDGLVRAFDQPASELTIDAAGGVEAEVHPLYCTPARDSCRFAWAWDLEARRLVERPAADGIAVLADGGFPVVEARPDDLPGPVREAFEAGRAACRIEGRLEAREPTLVSIPDVGGDGVRDWLFTPAVSCDSDEEAGTQVWISTRAGSGGFVMAYQAAADRFLAVDIASAPAVVLDRPGCGEDEPCAGVRLRLDRAGRRLVAP